MFWMFDITNYKDEVEEELSDIKASKERNLEDFFDRFVDHYTECEYDCDVQLSNSSKIKKMSIVRTGLEFNKYNRRYLVTYVEGESPNWSEILAKSIDYLH